MTKALAAFATAAVLSTAAVSASGATIDFTASPTPTDVPGVADFTVSAVGGAVTTTPFDGAAPIPGLASVIDGLGVGDDEISEGQSLTVAFDGPVLVSGFYFLDLFVSATGDDLETATVSFDGGPVLSFDAVEAPGGGAPGFLFASFDAIAASTLEFTIIGGNDAIAAPDFALAGIEVAAIPIPSSAVLFGTALVGLGLLRRKIKA